MLNYEAHERADALCVYTKMMYTAVNMERIMCIFLCDGFETDIPKNAFLLPVSAKGLMPDSFEQELEMTLD